MITVTRHFLKQVISDRDDLCDTSYKITIISVINQLLYNIFILQSNLMTSTKSATSWIRLADVIIKEQMHN